VAETRKGVLKSFASGAYTAGVQITGSLGVYLPAVPVSRGIPATELTASRGVAVIFFDAANPDDAVVSAVWG
jgi:hypothetical protein